MNTSKNLSNLSTFPRLTEKEAAALLGWSPRTLQMRRWQGLPPKFYKLGRSVRYSEADLLEFIEKSARNSTSDPGPTAG